MFWFQVGIVPVNPLYGVAVATIVPLPVGPRLAPVPTNMAAVVFVLPVSAEKAVLAVEVDEIVWLGQLPLIVTFDPATILGVDVPVPPFAIPTMPVTFAAVPVVDWFHVGTVPLNWE